MFQNALFLMPPKCTQKGILTRSYCIEGIFFGFFFGRSMPVLSTVFHKLSFFPES